jgi:hypothetical protein
MKPWRPSPRPPNFLTRTESTNIEKAVPSVPRRFGSPDLIGLHPPSRAMAASHGTAVMRPRAPTRATANREGIPLRNDEDQVGAASARARRSFPLLNTWPSARSYVTRARNAADPVVWPGSVYAWLCTSATVERLARGRTCWAAGQIGESTHPDQRVSAKDPVAEHMAAGAVPVTTSQNAAERG